MPLFHPSTGAILAAVALLIVPDHARAADKAGVAPGKGIYDRECAQCHGPDGKGDGETAAYITPPPQDFTKGDILSKRSDEFLTTVIAKGGPAKGLSESMPATPKLSPADLKSVVAYIRQLGKGTAGQKAK